MGLYNRFGFYFHPCHLITDGFDIRNSRANGFFKGDGFTMEINGKYPITRAWCAIVTASSKQRVGKVVSQFEGVGKN